MAIILPYESPLKPIQAARVDVLKNEFTGEARINLYKDYVQVALYERQMSIKRGIALLDALVDALHAEKWGSDIKNNFKRENPPDVYEKYRIKVPYDHRICYQMFIS
jgi:hypothetical protein